MNCSLLPKGVLIVSLAAVWMLLAKGVSAEKGPERNSRFFVGVGSSPPSLHSVSLRVNGQEAQGEEGEWTGIFTLGYSQSILSPWLGLTGAARWGSWNTTWSEGAGEGRSRLDIAFAPEVRLRLPPFQILGKGVDSHFHVGFPIGPTIGWISPRQQRTLYEEFSTGYGFNVGITAGAGVTFSKHGVFGEVSYLVHKMSFDHTIQSGYSSGGTIEDSYKFFNRQLIGTFGYMVRL